MNAPGRTGTARGEAVAAPEGGKARRVYLLLRDRITRGVFPVGSAIPGEQRLAADFDVSRVTVRRALEALGADGLIEKRPGSGTIVRASGSESVVAGDIATLMPQLLEMVQSTEARLLAFSYDVPSQQVSDALDLERETRVQTAVRVRLIEGVAFSHLTTHVPEDIARSYSEADLATTPLFRLLERSGVTISDASQSVTATLATPETAAALSVEVGTALLSIERVVRDANGRAVEFLQALYRPDLFRLEMALARVGDARHRHWAPVLGGEEGSQ